MSLNRHRLARWAFVLFVALPHASGWAERPIRVAVFKGDGVGASANDLVSAFDAETGTPTKRKITVRRINVDEIHDGGLSEIDVLVHPGGSGSGQGKALGVEGRDAVRRFVNNGGGYLGICAGCYLATNDYDWSLKLIDAKCVDRRHWARGKGDVKIKLSPTASTFFGHLSDQVQIYYGQGPLLGRPEWDDPETPDYQSLAIYDSEIAEKGAPKGIMKGTSAIARASFGRGRVFCFSPHPEMTDGLEHMIGSAVRWLARPTDQSAIEVDSISQVVHRYFPQGSPGGIAVLVTRDGDVLHRKGYGFVNGVHLRSDAPLSLASVTKQFTAACAMILIENGSLDPNEKVSHYLPDLHLPKAERELKIRDLVWHVSGLPNFIEAKEKSSIADFKEQRGLDFLTNQTHAEWLATMELRRSPGTRFEYTNSGYVLLARIIEELTGEAFYRFQQRRIFDVLEMDQTTDSTRFNGSGNMKTTLLDYEKWDRAVWKQDSRLLTPKGYERIFEGGVLDNGEPIDYGYGWRLHRQNGQLVWAEHGGVGSGTTSARNLVRRYIADRTTVAIFAQERPSLSRSERDALVCEIYDRARQPH